MSEFAKSEQVRQYAINMQALKRVAQPDDIGGVVAFLASNEHAGSRAMSFMSMVERNSESLSRGGDGAVMVLSGGIMAESIEQENKELVLKAFHTLFNERNYEPGLIWRRESG